jgi:tRNA-2-methylthio-N6-dimethylallyladenosine synthase
MLVVEKNCPRTDRGVNSILDYREQSIYIKKVRDLNSINSKTYFIRTFGCQMNESDSEKLSGIMMDMGFIEAEDIYSADFVIFNTCCVREGAEQKVYGHLGDMKKLKEEKPELKLALCGCMAQQERVVEKLKKSYKNVDMVFGTHNFHELPRLYYENITHNKRIYEIRDIDGLIVEEIPQKRVDKYRAYISIMYGCNNFCSYCIVPYVRGRERSRKHETILDEVRELVKDGYKEITLLGQNVNSYGNTKAEDYSFADLLRAVNDIDGKFRIRFMTSHPKDMSEDTILAIKECEKICNHIHLPFQAGSTNILKEMNRNYKKEDYLALIKLIKNIIPGITFTTDVIVGFPGETEEDFRDTLDIIEKIRFNNAYMFIYSPREGTPAMKLTDDTSESEKKSRFQRLLDKQHEISRELNEMDEGKVFEILVEGFSKKDKSYMCGRTESNKIINFRSENEGLQGSFVKVKVIEAKTWHLEGELII